MITVLFHNVAIGIVVCYARVCFKGSRSDDLKFFRFLNTLGPTAVNTAHPPWTGHLNSQPYNSVVPYESL